MSGIFGIWAKHGPLITPEQLDAMATPLASYGPDGEQTWCDGNIGLGHKMLHTTPESRQERLPLSSTQIAALQHCGPFIVTADARIDNRTELFKELNIAHALHAEMPDSTLILYAYEKWGHQCPKYLLGAYAFVVWDQKAQTLFCARDHVGARPFYYYDSPARFLFATDIQAILASPEVPQRLDSTAIEAAQYMETRALLNRTLFHDILKLPPAHSMVIKKTGQYLERYWQLGEVPRLHMKSIQECTELIYGETKRAVAACTRSAFPIGSHLSGGLDSSSVTVLAAQQLRAQKTALACAFTWSPAPITTGDALQNEHTLIEAVCQQEGISCWYNSLQEVDVINLYQRDISREPTAFLFCEPAVRRAALAQGIRIMLSGWGGDEIVTYNGDGYLAQLLHQGRWRKLGQELYAYQKIYGGTHFNLLRTKVLEPYLPDWLLQYRERNNAQPGQIRYSRAAAKRLWRNRQQVRPRPTPDHTRRRRWEDGHITARLEAWAAQTDGHYLDYRYPLLDRKLLDLCFAIPPSYFLHTGWKRYIYRRAMEGVLPDAVCWNRSKGDPAREQMVRTVLHQAQVQYFTAIRQGKIQLPTVPSFDLQQLIRVP